MQKHRLFVYGSLKRGFCNHEQMYGAVFRGAAVTAPGYALFLVGDYPALVATVAGSVSGELYEVTNEHLLRLDVFEGHPRWYRREAVALADGTTVAAYTMSRECIDPRTILRGGVWSETHERSARRRLNAD